MNDLFKKLNTLVKAALNDFLGDDLAVGGPRRRPLQPGKLGKNIDREIAALRQRINEAVEYESRLQTQVQSIQSEVDRWDQQADEAVAQGQDATARHAVDQMQRARQRLNMADSDLREHQLVTEELIQRVNMLEAAVADARRNETSTVSDEPPSTAESEPEQTTGRAISDVLRDAREKIARMGNLIATKDDVASPPTASESADDQTVEDDLAVRRERLSKPKS
jgi:phage shock protein A